MMYTHAQVAGGKFHALVTPVDLDAVKHASLDNLETKCGRKVNALNVFTDLADVLDYCGNRPQYLCKQCERN